MIRMKTLRKTAIIATVLLGLGVPGLLGGCGSDAPKSNAPAASTKSEAKAEPQVPREYKNALKKAQQYSDVMHMSKNKLYEQLTSAYGEKFPQEAAAYAMEHVKADWNKNALEKAKTYQNTMSMSRASIYDQLVSDAGEGFTPEQAQYAVDHLPN